jgi:hypothetical protein
MAEALTLFQVLTTLEANRGSKDNEEMKSRN